LLTSKVLDYKDWCAVDDLLKKKDHRKHLKQIQALKACIPIIAGAYLLGTIYTIYRLKCTFVTYFIKHN
jgi:hypothetical protein